MGYSLSEAASRSSMVPWWYREQREEFKRYLNGLGQQMQTQMQEIETQVQIMQKQMQTQMKGVKGLITGQFQQLMVMLQGQFVEQTALKS